MHSLIWLLLSINDDPLEYLCVIFPRISLTGEQAIFRKSEQKYLPNQVLQTKETNSELECGLHCVAEKSCTSVNYKTRGCGMGKGRSELNNKTVEKTVDFDKKNTSQSSIIWPY